MIIPEDTEAAVNKVFGAYEPALSITVELAGRDFCDNEGPEFWQFVTNEDGTLGFWYPTMHETYNVTVPSNYYQNPAMDGQAFGAAVTLMAVNHLLWANQNQPDNDALIEKFYKLREWIFDMSDVGQIDGAAIAGFID